MESNMENNIRFLIQREMLLSLLKSGEITQDEYDKTLAKLRSKHNCKNRGENPVDSGNYTPHHRQGIPISS